MNVKTLSDKDLQKEIKRRKAAEIYVTFYSPGTLFSETSSIKIKGPINLSKLVKKAKDIKERHGATPYGFGINDGNGKSLTGCHFINGTILKYDDIPENSETHILRSNMRCNDNPIAIETRNSYRHTAIFTERDLNISDKGEILHDGGASEFCEYRKKKLSEWADNRKKGIY